MLKKSARNCIVKRSVRFVVLYRAKFHSLKDGPCKEFRLSFPKCRVPGTQSAEVPVMVAVVRPGRIVQGMANALKSTKFTGSRGLYLMGPTTSGRSKPLPLPL